MFDWYNHSPEVRAVQIRTPITDGIGEPWIWRQKDLRSWWMNAHHNRVGCARSATPTAWQPGSKPIWFTEYGCAALDRGTNQPNKFLDPKSSESRLPRYSNGMRDDFIQVQYLRAIAAHYALLPDGDNYDRGHWLNGRASSRSLASVVTEICAAAGGGDQPHLSGPI